MQPQQIQLKATDEDLKGRFSNIAQISHQEEHFVLDFFMLAPPAGHLVSRVVTTPSHMKALANAINDNLKKYEENFGKVKPAKQEKQIGFKVNKQG